MKAEPTLFFDGREELPKREDLLRSVVLPSDPGSILSLPPLHGSNRLPRVYFPDKKKKRKKEKAKETNRVRRN